MNSKINNRRGRIGLLCIAAVALAASFADKGEALAPPGRYTISNGTVYDTKTKLTWQQIPSPDKFSWSDAQMVCANLALDGNGWRAPSMKELQTIVDETALPAIDSTAFPDGSSDPFWTSTMIPDRPLAWIVKFTSGDLNSGSTAMDTYQVRCVR